MLLIHLCQIDGEFCPHMKPSQVQAIRHLLKRNQIVYRAVTHESQKSPEETSGIASDFIVSMIPRVLGIVRDQQFILNMDQSPVYFCMTQKQTLAKSGSRTVNGWTTKIPQSV